MNLKYCSNCGKIGDFVSIKGVQRCESCKVVGKPLEGTIDQINAFAKKVKAGKPISRNDSAIGSTASQAANAKTNNQSPSSNNEWKEKFKSLKGKIIGAND